MELSCAFAPRPDLPELVAHAEQLGYTRAWVYDSPALFGDVWIELETGGSRGGVRQR